MVLCSLSCIPVTQLIRQISTQSKHWWSSVASNRRFESCLNVSQIVLILLVVSRGTLGKCFSVGWDLTLVGGEAKWKGPVVNAFNNIVLCCQNQIFLKGIFQIQALLGSVLGPFICLHTEALETNCNLIMVLTT